MKKTSGGTQSQRKQRGTAGAAKRSVWSIEKVTVLRRQPSLPRAGDCSCCSGK